MHRYLRKKYNFRSFREFYKSTFEGKNKVDVLMCSLIMIFFSFIIHPLVDSATTRYYPQILVEVLCFGMIFVKYHRFTNTDFLLFGVLILCFSQVVIHPQVFRFSTVAYSVMFCSVFIVYRQVLGRIHIKPQQFLYILELFLKIYAIVLLIQQICAIAGLPVPNLNSDGSSLFKLNSLTWESSNLACITSFFFFVYIKTKEVVLKRKYNLQKDFKKDRMVWFLFFYLNLTCGSMSGFASTAIIMGYFMKPKNFLWIGVAAILFILAIPLFAKYDIFNFERITDLISGLSEMKVEDIALVDASAACRIVPYKVFLGSVNPIDFNFWFGHGVDSCEEIAKYIIISDDFDRNIGAQNIVSFFYDYGMIAGSLLIAFIAKNLSFRTARYNIIIYIFVFSLFSINHPVFWLMNIIFYPLSRFTHKEKKLRLRIQREIRLRKKKKSPIDIERTR